MAVDLDPFLLLKPDGELASSMLAAIADARSPVSTRDAVLVGYADAGLERVKTWTDDAVALRGAVAWAYYAAFSERADQILSGEMSANAAGEGGVSYSPKQAEDLLARADTWKAAYDAAEQTAQSAGLPFVAPRASRTVVNVFRW